MSAFCHRLYVRHLYLVSLFFWWGMYKTDILHDIILSYFIKKWTLKTKKKLKKSFLIQSHILRFLPTSTIHGSFVQYQNFESPSSSESLWNFLRLQYSECLQILLRLCFNPEVEKLQRSVQIRIFSSHWQLSETITPKPLVQLWCMNNCGMPEKVTYNLGFQSFLSFQFEGCQKFEVPKSYRPVQTKISSRFGSHNS
jgi:hypothetical protein